MFGSGARPTGQPLSTDPSQLLQQVAQNTSELVRWMKYLVFAVVILLVVTAVSFL